MSNTQASEIPFAELPSSTEPMIQGPLPAGLRAVCVIAIILGGLGMLKSCGGVMSLAVGQSMQQMFNPPAPAGVDPEVVRAQQEFQKQLMAVGQSHLPFRIGLAVLHLLAAITLLLGGILALKLSPRGRWILVAGCLVAILFELAQASLGVMDSIQSVAVFKQIAGQGGAQGPMAEMWATLGPYTGVGLAVIIGFTLVLSLVKIAFYVFSILYLQRPRIVARFAA